MESLTTFLPLDRRRALAAGGTLPDRIQGTALFADISGFTPLTAVLARELGVHRGAEELTRNLNRVYTALIAEVHRYHGSVINFSGDAITCWFDHTNDAEARSPALALACALAMQRVMARMEAVTTPGGTTITLGLKVALATGPARRFLIGDPDTQRIEVLAGATLDRMAAAEKQAEQGDVVVTADFLDHLPHRPTVAGWRVDAYNRRYAQISDMTWPQMPPDPPPIPPLSETAVRSWLLPPVYSRLQQGSDEFLAELRPAASLFVNFSGIDYDGDDDAGEKLDTFVQQAQTILNHYEGFLLQITMGDKGSYLYAAFGAPLAHEDDAMRALAAALDLRALADRLPFLQPAHIGISQGLTHSGAYGSPVRRTYGVMGNHVNIAARLMSIAQPGQILVSQSIAEATAQGFALTTLPPVMLKGIRNPFPLWELKGRRETFHATALAKSQGAMVGREAEWRVIETALARLMEGRSTALLVEGPAGIGKSRLAQELVMQVTADSAVVLLAQGDAVEKSTTYHAWQPIFGQLIGLPADGPEDEARRAGRVTESLPAEVRSLAPLLNAVLPVSLPENELTAQMTGEVRQENTLQLLMTVLKTAVAERPLLLVLEDAHWLDSGSWALVRRVHREFPALLLVIITRPFTDDTPAVYADLRELATTQRVVLDALPVAAVDQMICQRLGVRRLPPVVADLIHQKAEGHPFFSEELAYALRDAGLIEIVGEECRLAAGYDDFRALDFPNTIQGVITSRIDLLPPSQQLTVKVASVVGRVFAFRLLRDIFPVETERPNLMQHLTRLDKLDITPMETPEPNLAYIFKHIVTQEVVYSLMTFAQRRQLHRNTAVWYEQISEKEERRYYPLLAHHWHLAGVTEKAVSYYGKAGEDAFHNYANQEAIRFLTQAIELSGEGVSALQLASWHRQVAEAAYRLTLMEKSQTHYEAALALVGRPLPKSTARRALGLLRQLAQQIVHRLQPDRFVGRAASTVEHDALLETARTHEAYAEIFYNLGDFLTSTYCIMTSFNLAERAGASPELVRGYANMCATLGAMSLNGPADNYRARALQTAAKIDDINTKADIQIPLSVHSLWVGEWERAEREIDAALTIYSRLGDWRHWCVAAWLWPQVAQGKGELNRARDLWAELLSVARRSQDTRHQVRSLGGQMFNFLTLGDMETAFACVADAAVILEENPEMMPLEERLWYAMTATQALHREEWEQAREVAQSLLQAIARARFKYDLLEVFATAAEVFLALREQGLATDEEAQQGCKVLDQYARTYAFARPRALRLQARRAWLGGKARRAAALWRKSAARAQKMGMRYEQGATLDEMGRYLQMDACRAQADEIAAEIGAWWGNGRPSAATPAATD